MPLDQTPLQEPNQPPAKHPSAHGNWNDAEVIGDDCPEWQTLLKREATFFVGKSGKLTKWPVVSATWHDWIDGGPDGGFSIHRASKKKSSRAVVMASFTGTARKADAVTHLHALALDFDSGTSRKVVEAKIEALGVAAIVYTSHSDQKTRSKVNHKALERAFPDIDPAQISDSMLRLFLRDHSPTVWADDHIDSATITEADGTSDDGPVVWYDHAPLDKFRVVFPLSESVTVKDLGRDQQERKSLWADKVTGAARVWLDGHFDRSCTDLSRVFYMPEHPPGKAGSITIFRAPPVRFEDIPTHSKKDYAAEFSPVAHRKNGGEAVLPSGERAKVWAAQNDHADRLELGKMIDDNAPGRVRDDKGNGLYVVECPFEEMHGNWGGTGTHVRDAEGEGLSGFSFECRHDSCAGLDRLDLLAAALDRWEELDENWIWSDADEGGYLLEAGEVIEDDDEDDPADDDTDHQRGDGSAGDGDGEDGDTVIDDEAGECAPASAGQATTDDPIAQRMWAGSALEPGKGRSLSDPLFDAGQFLKKDGFVKGKGATKQENVTQIRVEMAESMRAMFDWVIIDGGDARIFMKAERGGVSTMLTKAGLMDLMANRVAPYTLSGKKVHFIHPANVFRMDSVRKTYIGTQFEPDKKKAHPNRYNFWTGIRTQPRAGDWSLLKGHIRDQIIAGNESANVSADYLFNWFVMRYAHLFQYPGDKMPNSVAFRGGEGVGKSKFCFWIREAIGAAALKIAQRKQLVGNFNAGLDGKIYVTSEEAFFSGDKQAASALKDLVSDDRIQIEKKFQDAVDRSNYIRLDSISNEDWVIPAGENGDGRRWLVLDVNDNKKQDRAFFAAIDAQMRNGGLEAMVYDLMTFDPAEHGMDWAELHAAPWTPARADQVAHGLSGPKAMLKQIIDSGVITGRTEDGLSFHYNLDDDEETVVARIHLNAVLSGGKSVYGGAGRKIQDALDDMLGVSATCSTRREVLYFENSGAASAANAHTDASKEKVQSKTVAFPPMDALRARLSTKYG